MFKRTLLWVVVAVFCLLAFATATTWWWCQDALSIPAEAEQLVLYAASFFWTPAIAGELDHFDRVAVGAHGEVPPQLRQFWM